MQSDQEALKAAVAKRHPGNKSVDFDAKTDNFNVVVGGVDSLTVVPMVDAKKWAVEDTLTTAVAKRQPGAKSIKVHGDLINVDTGGKLSVVARNTAQEWADADAANPSGAGSVCHDVTVDHMAFNPSVVTAAPGDCICWTFKQAGHSVVSDDAGKCFDSGIMAVGATFEHTVPTDFDGTIGYHCGPMPKMKGTITVIAAPAAGGSSAQLVAEKSPWGSHPPGVVMPEKSPGGYPPQGLGGPLDTAMPEKPPGGGQVQPPNIPPPSTGGPEKPGSLPIGQAPIHPLAGQKQPDPPSIPAGTATAGKPGETIQHGTGPAKP